MIHERITVRTTAESARAAVDAIMRVRETSVRQVAPARTSTSIEYLDVYLAALDHQRDHGSLRTALFASEAQPNEYCLECLNQRLSAGPYPGFPAPTVEDPKSRWKCVKRRYAWAVPTAEALDLIAQHSPNGAVEVGAGGGYWAMLLRERDVDVVAYDPAGAGDTWHTGPEWTEVLPGDHAKAAEHPERTLFLCWPSYAEGWAAEAVELFYAAGGKKVVFIGEGVGGCTADDRFFALVGEVEDGCASYHFQAKLCDCNLPDPLFRTVETLDIPQWFGLHDYMRVYERV